MAEAQTGDYTLSIVDGGPQKSGTARLKYISKAEGTKMMLIIWFSMWALAAATIPIPIVHLIAPPTLFLLGPIIGFVVAKLFADKTDVLIDEPACPGCGKPVFLPRAIESWPISETCQECGGKFTGTLAEETR